LTEPDAYVDWKSQCIYPAENIKDPTGLQPVWFGPQPEAIITDEMVERAAGAILTEQEANRSAFPDNRDLARAALTAALILPTHKPLQEEG
jgi:hypothetical protein